MRNSSFFLGTDTIGVAHWLVSSFTRTPSSSKCRISFSTTPLIAKGTGHGRQNLRVLPSLRCNLTGTISTRSSSSRNTSSYLSNISNNFGCSLAWCTICFQSRRRWGSQSNNVGPLLWSTTRETFSFVPHKSLAPASRLTLEWTPWCMCVAWHRKVEALPLGQLNFLLTGHNGDGCNCVYLHGDRCAIQHYFSGDWMLDVMIASGTMTRAPPQLHHLAPTVWPAQRLFP